MLQKIIASQETNTARRTIIMHQTFINASRVFVVFCKPILAILLQRKRLIARNASHASHVFVVFCKPILAILLQRKRLIASVATKTIAQFQDPYLRM